MDNWSHNWAKPKSTDSIAQAEVNHSTIVDKSYKVDSTNVFAALLQRHDKCQQMMLPVLSRLYIKYSLCPELYDI